MPCGCVVGRHLCLLGHRRHVDDVGDDGCFMMTMTMMTAVDTAPVRMS